MSTSTPNLTDEFIERSIDVRGRTYKFRELEASQYDEIAKKATKGEEGDVDMNLLLKLMVVRSSVDPKLTVEEVGTKPFRVLRLLTNFVYEMHFGDEPKDEEAGNA